MKTIITSLLILFTIHCFAVDKTKIERPGNQICIEDGEIDDDDI